ncbi:hypothetical protein [Pseudozobellia thermophila]|uniref:Uncharacterized protein n=1 Tax=Pseudozobellia thermophila TaxID=192903 RepID=A0A1M6HUQ4_9FLAO|nr:hypothetical protein [Pseudozobellia thermophila]SHJ25854.1 hypothetical protein SAMN04488513_103187 [Pseudozobellia thermophila]
MSIRLGNSCVNCENLVENHICKVHGVEVGTSYTCDSFEMKAMLKDKENCVSCVRYETSDCANPQKAAPGMSCAHWAPQGASA